MQSRGEGQRNYPNGQVTLGPTPRLSFRSSPRCSLAWCGTSTSRCSLIFCTLTLMALLLFLPLSSHLSGSTSRKQTVHFFTILVDCCRLTWFSCNPPPNLLPLGCFHCWICHIFQPTPYVCLSSLCLFRPASPSGLNLWFVLNVNRVDRWKSDRLGYLTSVFLHLSVVGYPGYLWLPFRNWPKFILHEWVQGATEMWCYREYRKLR